MEKILEKTYLTSSNLLTAQDLWQARYEIFSIILLKQFIKLNDNNMIIVLLPKHLELSTKIESAILNTLTLKLF